uniref:Uncharacterized protein n=1 Tax=Musa acuminata subsp. malaccensis TaxID=214687 RepID=A0A804J4K6_MUSAM
MLFVHLLRICLRRKGAF